MNIEFKYITALLVISIITSINGFSQNTDTKIYYIEDFEDEAVGGLPLNWYNQLADKKTYEFSEQLRKSYNYEIMEENGNKFLRFDGIKGKHLNYPLADKNDINIHETPLLNWKWRIHTIPEGANEKNDSTNDVAASIYVVFDMGRVLFKKVPKSIRYTWSSTLPEGKELTKFFGNQRIVVVGTGENNIGEWQTFERNIVQDYKRLFGDTPPKQPIAILMLSDGISTGKAAKADYDDIYLKSN